MLRTQIQMREDQIKKLKRLASAQHRSVADLIREAVDNFIAVKGGVDIKERQKRAFAAAGRFHSGLTDLSGDHDKYLIEDFKK